MIVAKAVIPNQYWILKQDDRKIGNIQADPSGGFQVRINNHVEKFRTIHIIKRQVSIDFENNLKCKTPKTNKSVHGFPTSHMPHNGVFDVKHQVPLWTKEPRSKSWYAAGWYRVKQGRDWHTVFCPKLITIQRYAYQGPFTTKEQADL